jgi:hypothetical protein
LLPRGKVVGTVLVGATIETGSRMLSNGISACSGLQYSQDFNLTGSPLIFRATGLKKVEKRRGKGIGKRHYNPQT